MSSQVKEWRLKACTDLWTGSVKLEQRDGRSNERIVSDKLVTTGLLGSIRWWLEVLVRGLSGPACDPSFEDRKNHPTSSRCPDPAVKQAMDLGHHCVVCELFGCTGWARKFRFEVQDGSGAIMEQQITRDTTFSLCFTPLRPIVPEEWALLDLTIRLIADYGAIGGKTVLKPSDEAARRDLPHHRDYGIVKVEQRPDIQPRSQADLERYTRDSHWRKPSQQDFAWASLKNFWCVDGKYLARQGTNQSTFNKVVGRDERKACVDCGAVHDRLNRCPQARRPLQRYSERLVASAQLEQWLAGQQQKSKKVFSFKEPPRTFGFVNPDVISVEQMKKRLEEVWSNLGDDVMTGDVVLSRLMSEHEAAP